MPSQDLISAIIGRLPVPARLQSALYLGWDTLRNYGAHRDGETAAAIAYYGLFAIFPLILFTMSLLGYLVGAADRQDEIVQAIAERIPGARDLLDQTIRQVKLVRGAVTIFSVVALLWSASGAFSLLAIAIDRAWCVGCGRPIWKEKLVAIGLTLVFGLLIIVAIASSSFVQIVRRFGGSILPPDVAALFGSLDVLGFGLAIVSNIMAFLIIYKWLPTVRVPWRAALLGASVAGIAWEIAKNVFAWYLSTFAVKNLSLVYGSLTAVLALLLWTYFSAVILLLGAELCATYAQGPTHQSTPVPVEGHE